MKWIMSILGCMLMACTEGHQKSNKEPNNDDIEMKIEQGREVITLGGGCFWCTEAVFQQLNGVDTVISGYMGGNVKNPTYREICTGTTGHAEVIQVIYNPEILTVTEILEVFFATHDPTTLNRQGADVGTQYRSVVFYHNEEQRKTTEEIIQELNKAKVFNSPIVTQIAKAEVFYPAEDYHQNYYNLNSNQSYCAYVITPKLEKFQNVFKDKLKK
jgi:peptide-methionine (S)-S-oxide reductase